MATLPFCDINIHASPTHYTFRSPSDPDAPALVIDRPSGKARVVDHPVLSGKRVTSIAGILGIVRLRLDSYIIVITKAMHVGYIRGHSAYKVQGTEFLPLQEPALHVGLSNKPRVKFFTDICTFGGKDHDEDAFLSLLRAHIRSGSMYFSYSFNLTNSFQRQSAAADASLPLWQRADDRFFWNRYIQSDLINLRSSNTSVDRYILPVLFGFLKIVTSRIKNTPLTFILVTRKSRFRAGTRYFTRGIDEEGHVANFNETEQIIVVGDVEGGMGARGYDSQSVQTGMKAPVQVLSYVQTRGSIPVYWAEVNNLHYCPKLHIRGIENALPAAKLHFEEQIKLYGDTYCINLVNQKGREEHMKAAFETIVKILHTYSSQANESSEKTPERFGDVEPMLQKRFGDRIHYVYFDFHHECKGMKLHGAKVLLDKLDDTLYNQRYFHSSEGGAAASTVRNTQTSVVRTNCMDCLDRTNHVQSMLARWVLDRQFLDLGILEKGETFANYLYFESMFRNAWADNADTVSRAYSGTGALKTDFTRTGVRTKNGAIADLSNSCTRYIRNNFADGPKQDAYDLFLGNYLPSGVTPSLIFVDRRPVLIQAVPYILLASIFLVVFAFIFADSRFLMKLFMLFWLLVGAYCARFIYVYGMLYVNWPKLNTMAWATEGYNEALGKVKKDKVVGPWVARHERGISSANIRLIHLEEGKKRIE